jgi:hypothetical protein
MLAAVSPRRFKSANHPHSERIALLFRQPAAPQLSYQSHVLQINRYVHAALHDRGQIGSIHWDSGTTGLLDDSADHLLMIRSGPSDVNVTIAARWFRDPTAYRHAIAAAIETAIAE